MDPQAAIGKDDDTTRNDDSITTTSTAVDVGSSTDFREGTGRRVEAHGRPIAVFRCASKLYALDHYCYHAGGPLSDARDIEDLYLPNKKKKKGNEATRHPCIICPWHKYKISLATGEGLYLHSDPFAAAPTTPQIKSRGRKQRTHKIWEDKEGRVYVVVDTDETKKYDSDYYASEDFQLRMKRWDKQFCCPLQLLF